MDETRINKVCETCGESFVPKTIDSKFCTKNCSKQKQVRSVWDEETEAWYFSIIDIIAILTESANPRRYWSDLKVKLQKEGSQLYEEIVQLKLESSDDKFYKTDVATSEQLFRLIQSIPSPKAEPFKLWIAEVAKQRLDQMQDPELSIGQAITDYKRLGYSDNWINQRLKSIEIRKDLTDEWKRHGLKEGSEFGTPTDIIYKTWFDKTVKEYKQFKGLKKENQRDIMINKELVLNMLVELSSKEISESTSPETFHSIEQKKDSRDDLLSIINKIHTTELGAERIKKNLSLETDDVVIWCKQKIQHADKIIRRGKNWYAHIGDIIITVNANSYTIITAHKNKRGKAKILIMQNECL